MNHVLQNKTHKLRKQAPLVSNTRTSPNQGKSRVPATSSGVWKANQQEHISLVDIDQLNTSSILDICERAATMKGLRSGIPMTCAGKIMYSLFFTPSTRTRFSTETAWMRLGGSVITLESASRSSISKGESLEHTLQMFAGYQPDIIAIRTGEEGVAQRAADLFPHISWVNCGDGSNQHPTQALLDVFTIWEQRGSLEGVSIAFIGDIKHGRTIRSLATVLSWFGAKMHFVAPDSLHDESYYTDHKIAYQSHTMGELQAILESVEYAYCTRPQIERMSESDRQLYAGGAYQILPTHFDTSAAHIMHPLPIDASSQPELHPELDSHPQSIYFKQAQNGLWVRAALFEALTSSQI